MRRHEKTILDLEDGFAAIIGQGFSLSIYKQTKMISRNI
jgi:hypothetical protein